MELKQIRYFLSVVHERNFSRAAKRCFVTQPTLSQGIQALEDSLGEPLFLRHPRNIQLTEAGEQLLERAMRVVDEVDEIQHLFDDRSELKEGKVTLGIIPTLAPFLLPQILSDFRLRYPEISLKIREAHTSRLIEATVAGDVDFSLTSDIEESALAKWSLFLKPLFAEPLNLAMPSSHPLARKKRISSQDLQKESLLFLTEGHCFREQAIQACLSRSKTPGKVIECEQLSTILALVQSGLGLAIIPQMACQQGSWRKLRFRPFARPAPLRQIALLKKRAQGLNPASQAFMDSILETTSRITDTSNKLSKV